MSALRDFFLAARLAWRQLRHDRAKLIAATMGVLFACILVFMQLGFRDSLNASAASAPVRMTGDIFLIHKQTEALWRTVPFERSLMMRALAHPAVDHVWPLYMQLGQFKNLDTRGKRTLMVYGFDPDAGLMDIEAVRQHREELKLEDTVLFDRASRPEFGNVAVWLAEGRTWTELNDHRVNIIGLMLLGTSFAADGNVMTSELNFQRIFPNRSLTYVDMGAIYLKPTQDREQVKAELMPLLGSDVLVLTYPELIRFEQKYWAEVAPIGFIFGFGVIMGLVVGMVIVYQILFTDISNNLGEFATLKAMGYSQGYLIRVVFASALILAVLGFIPGLLISIQLYRLAESVIFIPFPMPLSKIISVFLFILAMCAVAGALAMRKLKDANPADMF
ncbi:MAG: ABC transporter permease DevC [Pseudomonadota bacterium]|nr:ABC transporter permease DevC [Pseudomonadota bacterium]